MPFTTREPRSGEVEGVDYRFLDSAEAFGAIHDETPMFDILTLKGNQYGTPLQDFVDVLESNGEIRSVNLAAASALDLRERMRKRGLHAVKAVFVLPQSYSDIERQMREAGISVEQIALRLSQEPTDLALLPYFDQIVINEYGTPELAAQRIAAFLGHAACAEQ